MAMVAAGIRVVASTCTASLAQRRLRHKCAKGVYQFMYWLVVGVWQYVALEVLLGWKITRTLFAWL